MNVGVVADDLTGGATIAAELTRYLGPVPITRRPHTLPRDETLAGPAPELGAVVINTDSRYGPVGPAVGLVRSAIDLLRGNGYRTLMKKVDSTLQGHIGAELAAFAERAATRLLVAPACPFQGLRVRNGRQHTRDGPGTDIAALLTGALPAAPGLLGHETVRGGATAIADWLRDHPAPVVLADADTDDDLARLATGATDAGITAFAGTYGLGAALARTGGEPAERSMAGRSRPGEPVGPRLPAIRRLLVLSGSAAPRATEQVAALIRDGAAEVAVAPEALLTDPDAAQRDIRDRVHDSTAPVVVLHTDPARTGARTTAVRDSAGWTPRDLADRLAGPMLAAVRAMPGAGLCIVGGETAGATIDRLGISEYPVVAEPVPGVAAGVTGRPDVPVLVSKPGAFGPPDSLRDTASRLLPG